FPAAVGAGRHLATAADGARVAVRGRDRTGPAGPDGRAAAGVSVLAVTGTDTGGGRTVATAGLAGHGRLAGIGVAVCKPVQTGSRDGDDDLAEVARLSGTTELHWLARYPEPLAPLAAAVRAGAELPTRAALVDLVTAVDRPGRLTLVEGAGG